MKTQLNSHINVASVSFNLTDQLREMNESVSHWKIHMCQAHSFSEVLWNYLFYTFQVEKFSSGFLKILVLRVFLQLCTNRATFSCGYAQIESHFLAVMCK